MLNFYTMVRRNAVKLTELTFSKGDGILGHQFNKRLESFAPCYSQSLLLADFKENHTFSGIKNPHKNIRETRNLESIHE